MKNIKPIIIIAFGLILTSCVQEVHLKTITFKVDMSSIEAPEYVGVRGNFTDNSWNETILLKDQNNDGIYEGTLSKETAVNQIQFKFVNNNDEYELKDSNNRKISFEYKPETILYQAVFNDPKEKITKN
ncbi:hypothetical protein [Winogradskyella vincentii]|uniref:Uncharacterized protein n=1 Tax=Winogradskyella vincentii TaxID=2877122 RepID=A0ABS7Y5D8_9FLAO|nr:hypothetical protein [Winogradskyella vincentii]MCA0153913.1 hypothetical protein [Winogradskyella vincentii]